MGGNVHAGIQAACHAFASIRMADDFQSQPVRFIDNCLDLFKRHRRAVDESCIRFPHVYGTNEILSGIDFDHIHAMQLRLANGGARKPRPVHVLVFREYIEEAEGLVIGIVVAGPLIQRLTHDLHSGPLHETFVNGIT